MRRAPFPIWATLIPIAGALVMWVVTRSPVVLVFAALGPLAALASRFDARRAERRANREGAAERERAAAERTDAERRAHDERVRDAWAEVFPVWDILAGRAPHGRGNGFDTVAGVADGFPVRVASTLRIGIVGPAQLVAALARSVSVQQVHAGSRGSVQQASDIAELSACDAVIDIRSVTEATLVIGPGAAQEFAPHYVAVHAADEWFRSTKPLAARPDGLPVRVGTGFGGLAHELDIVSGPHALVAGTTGSGKTELLRSWISALCSAHGPDELVIVGIDFKGGTGLGDFRDLPHIADLITDVSDHSIDRICTALQSEITRRERALAASDARSVSDLPRRSLPRLVIVVDEYQVVVDQTARATAVFADLAARGRALGIHLILATQHPSRSVRDQISSNCGLRIALRLIDPSESHNLIGETTATTLVHPGEAISRDENGLTRWSVAPLSPTDAERLRQAWRGHPRAEAPWLEAPATAEDVHALAATRAADAVVLLDRVEDRAFETMSAATLSATRVIGLAGTGKSTALRRIASCAVARGAEVLWADGLHAADAWAKVELALHAAVPTALLIDNLDDLSSRIDPEYRQRLQQHLRTLTQTGTVQLVTSSRTAAAAEDFFAHTIELQRPGLCRVDGVPGYVVPSLWLAPSPLEPREWRPRGLSCLVTDRVSLWQAQGVELGWSIEPVPRPGADLESFTGRSPESHVIVLVGSVEEWLMHRGGLLSAEVEVLIADGNPSDVRALRRQRELPPIIGPDEAWSLHRDGRIERVRLPQPIRRSWELQLDQLRAD